MFNCQALKQNGWLQRVVLLGALIASMFSPVFAQQSGGTVVVTAGVGSTITVTIPGTTMNLGTYDPGATTTVFPFQANFVHNVNPRTDVTITAVPASNTLTISNGASNYTVNFSGYTLIGGGGATMTGTFATGLLVTRARANTNYTFRFNTQAQSPIPLDAEAGFYTGSQTLSFSIL